MAWSLRSTGIVLAVAALLLGGAVQILPWKHLSATIGSCDCSYAQDLWTQHSSTTVAGNTTHTGAAYFDASTNARAPWLARLGGPGIALGLALVAVGAVLAVLQRRVVAGALTLSGSAIIVLAAVLFFVGLDKVKPTSYPTLEVGLSFYLVLAAGLAAAGGGLCYVLERTPAFEDMGGFEDVPSNVADRPRHLKCPNCGTVNDVPAGVAPVCVSCGHGAPPVMPTA